MNDINIRGRRAIAAAAFGIAITTAACGTQAPANDINAPGPPRTETQEQPTNPDAFERRTQQEKEAPGYPEPRIPDARP